MRAPLINTLGAQEMSFEEIQKKYGLLIEMPFVLDIKNREIVFDCLIKGYGSKNGMIIDKSWKKIQPYSELIIELGYGYSCLNLEKTNVQSFQEVLDDWGKSSA